MWPQTRFIGAVYKHTDTHTHTHTHTDKHTHTHRHRKMAKERITKQLFLNQKSKNSFKDLLGVFFNSFPNRRNS